MNEPESQNTKSKDKSWLPDINDLFQEVEKSLSTEQPTLYEAEGKTLDFDPTTPFIRAAAVLNTFEPETLKPVLSWQELDMEFTKDERNEQIRFLLGNSTMVIETGESDEAPPRWSLRDSARQEVLANLVETNLIEQALDANHEKSYDKKDAVQKVFTAALEHKLPPLQNCRLEELTILQRIKPWIAPLHLLPEENPPADALPEAGKNIDYYIERERLLDPFRRLIGRWENGEFIEHFRGRSNELRKLRSYVNVAQSEGYLESLKRAIGSAGSYLFNLHQRPPLVIHGPGGVGKSTLMAKFLLQHTEAQDEEQYPFAYIDFDNPDVGSVNLALILNKITENIAVQFPEAKPELSQIQNRLQIDAVLDPSFSRLGEFYSQDLQNIYKRYLYEKPFLLVFDTFEEVQQRSSDYTYEIFEFLGWFQSVFPRLRTVIAGRAPVTLEESQVAVENLPLSDLDDEAAQGFLMSQGITDQNIANEIIKLAGRHPLALKLAANLAIEEGLTGVQEAAGGTGLFAKFQRLWSNMDITGRLYNRLLNHIVDPEVRKLAHPGLILRRITPAIIREALALPCNLELSENNEFELFERLRRQVSLVSPAEPGVLRHRTDVRNIMLPLILNDKKELADQIQRNAVAFYETQDGTAARAEEIYHRLMLGESPRSVEKRWVDGLEAHLFSALDELPAPAQGFVAARINAARSDAIWATADLEDWEIYAEKRVRRQIEKGEFDRAYKVLMSRPERTAASRLFGLEALLEFRQGNFQKALELRQKALNIYSKFGVHTDLIDELSKITME